MGSDSGSDTQTSTTTTSLPDYLKPYVESALQKGVSLSETPYTAYTGQRLAPLTDQHQAGLSMIENRATQGSPLNSTTQSFLSNTMQGQYSPQVGTNPYMGMQSQGAYNPFIGQTSGQMSNGYLGMTSPMAWNPYIGQNTQGASNSYIGQTAGDASNQFIGQQTEVGKNQYAGSNPYLEPMIQKTLGDVQGRVNSQFNGNAFGGSANQELLGRELGNTSNAMRMQDYGMQQQLAEADIARRAQYSNADLTRNAGLQQNLSQFNVGTRQADLARNAQLQQQQGQFNAGLSQADLARNSQLMQQMSQFNSGLTQADIGRNAALAQQLGQFNFQLGQNDLTRNSQLAQQQGQFNSSLGQTDLARNAALGESGLNRWLEAYQGDMNDRMRAAALSPQAQAADYGDAQNMLAAGDIRRQASQDDLNLQYENWLRQQQYPYQQMDVLSNTLLGAQGGGSSSTTYPNPYQPNTSANMLGGGLLGYGLGSMYGDGSYAPYAAAGGALLPWIMG